MADYVPLTNLRGPAARITAVSATSVPADQAAEVTMSGLDQNRSFAFKVPRGLPGVNALENDAAVATYVAAVDSDTHAALDNAFVAQGTLTVLAPRATGTDQLVALTAAMTSAASKGIALALNGDHVISGELVVPSGLRVDGRTGTLTQILDNRSLFRLENVTGVRITNVRGVGKRTDYANASSVYRSAGVYCTGTTNDVIVEGCTFLGVAGAGVYAAGTCSNIHVDRMLCTGAGPEFITGTAFNFGAGVVIMDGCSNWSVRNSDISLSAQGIVTGHAADNFFITGNWIHDIIGQHGIYLRAVSRGIISENRFENTVNQGIKLQITETGPVVPAENILITNNQFINMGVHAILMSSTVAYAISDVTISGNTIRGGTGGDGVVIDGAAINNITIADNRISGTNYGIRVTNGASDIWIHHNPIRNTQRTAISISGGSYITVEQNQIKAPGQAADIAANSGITIANVTDGFILSNRISDTTVKMRYGIYVTAGTMATLDIIENVATGATDFGARTLAENARAFRGNRFFGTLGTISGTPTNFIALADATDAATTQARANSLIGVARQNGQIR